ncbi:hypothetical protein C6501_00995 [Candidatus Poribacteria bacterium]|nr:MAG: hypothetical protein C6501_00995 [Candidatus Poribacteria bacterium]
MANAGRAFVFRHSPEDAENVFVSRTFPFARDGAVTKESLNSAFSAIIRDSDRKKIRITELKLNLHEVCATCMTTWVNID